MEELGKEGEQGIDESVLMLKELEAEEEERPLVLYPVGFTMLGRKELAVEEERLSKKQRELLGLRIRAGDVSSF